MLALSESSSASKTTATESNVFDSARTPHTHRILVDGEVLCARNLHIVRFSRDLVVAANVPVAVVSEVDDRVLVGGGLVRQLELVVEVESVRDAGCHFACEDACR